MLQLVKYLKTRRRGVGSDPIKTIDNKRGHGQKLVIRTEDNSGVLVYILFI